MAKQSAPVTIIPKPEPTHEELLAKVNEEVSWNFNHIEKQATVKLDEIRERLTDPARYLSNTISWVADDILLSEVRAEAVKWFTTMISPDADKQRTPWEAAVYIYRDLQRRLVDQSSYYGEDIRGCGTDPVANGMAHYRAKAISQVLRFDLSFVKHYAKKLGINLFFDAED